MAAPPQYLLRHVGRSVRQVSRRDRVLAASLGLVHWFDASQSHLNRICNTEISRNQHPLSLLVQSAVTSNNASDAQFARRVKKTLLVQLATCLERTG